MSSSLSYLECSALNTRVLMHLVFCGTRKYLREQLLFAYPGPGDGNIIWRPSWKQVITETFLSQAMGPHNTVTGWEPSTCLIQYNILVGRTDISSRMPYAIALRIYTLIHTGMHVYHCASYLRCDSLIWARLPVVSTLLTT